MSTLIGAVVGAIVGGIFAIAGSVFVGRHELTRRHRVTIYLTLLPDLLSALRAKRITPRTDSAARLAAKVEREATVASRADRKRARMIFAPTKDATTKATTGGFEEPLGRAVEAAESYGRWLEGRFSLVDRWRRRRRQDEEAERR